MKGDVGPADAREVEFSLVHMATILLRSRRFIIGSAVAAFTVVALTTLLLPDRYSAESIFVPQTRSPGGSGELGAIASQFGFELGGGGAPAESPQFYAGLISTSGLLREIADGVYEVDLDGETTRRESLPSLLGIEAETPSDSVRETARHLKDVVRATVDPTGRVHVRTEAPWPSLAIQINERIIETVIRFNRETRQSNARAEREFIESRLEEARQELRAAESAYTEFHEANRRIQGAPQLMARAAQLERQVQFRQQVYTSLAQAYENARIEEIRNAPLLTVVERAAHTVQPARGSFLMNGLVAAVIVTLLAIGGAFLREYTRRQRVERPEMYGEFMLLSKEARKDLRRPLRVLNAPAGRRRRAESGEIRTDDG